MRTYSLHFIYKLIFVGGLLFFTENVIEKIFDPSYMETHNPLVLAVRGCVCAYLWYVVFTTVYRIDIADDHDITATTLIKRTRIKAEAVTYVSDHLLPFFVRVGYVTGTLRIPNVMDGIGNVKSLFM